MGWKEFTGKTVDDALTEAAIRLETTSDKIEYEILEHGSNGLLGIGRKPAKIKARKKGGVVEAAREFLEKVFDAMKLDVKIEINYMMRAHILEPLTRKTSVPFIEEVDVYALAPLELFGSKIKALIERAAPRDMYDVNRMIKENIFKEDQMDMLRKIVVFYLAVGGKNKPIKEYSFERIQNIRFPQIRSALIPVLKKTEKFDFEEAKSNVISFLTTLLILGDAEKKFIDSFNQGEYKPELLFDDGKIIERIKEHPMALWKINNAE